MVSNPLGLFLLANDVSDFKVEDKIENWCIHYREFPKRLSEEEILAWINYDDYEG